MDNLTNSLTIISALFGLLSILLTVGSSIRNYVVQNSKLNNLKKKEFEIILESSNIVELGKYLDNEIGQLTISDYVDNKQLTKRVDSLLNKLIRFVGTEDEINAQQNNEDIVKSEIEQQIQEFPLKGKLGSDFDRIISELYTGEPWNALTQLRRYIEILLKDIAIKHNLNVEKVYSVNQLIEILKRNGIIEIDIAKNLKYPINVSNKAIHGHELKQGEAEKAIYQAAYSIDKIINTDSKNR